MILDERAIGGSFPPPQARKSWFFQRKVAVVSLNGRNRQSSWVVHAYKVSAPSGNSKGDFGSSNHDFSWKRMTLRLKPRFFMKNLYFSLELHHFNHLATWGKTARPPTFWSWYSEIRYRELISTPKCWCSMVKLCSNKFWRSTEHFETVCQTDFRHRKFAKMLLWCTYLTEADHVGII